MLAYYFPPDSSSGSMRPFFFANHLKRMGLDVTVLTAREQDFLQTQPKDPMLLRRLDPEIEVVRSGVKRPREFLLSLRKNIIGKNKDNRNVEGSKDRLSTRKPLYRRLKDAITDMLASPDPHVGWIPSAVRAGMRCVRKKRADVIYATGGPWSCLIAGALLRKKTGLPLIVDFRDPWISNPNFELRSEVVRPFEEKMEAWVLQVADVIITNTCELKQDLLKRHLFMYEKKVIAITNGFENYIKSGKGETDKFVLLHAGALYFKRDPRPLLGAVKNLLDKAKIDFREVRLVLVGEIENKAQILHDFLKLRKVGEIVNIFPRVSQRKISDYMNEANVLLIIQPGFPLQIPRKLFDYLAYKKPILAITEKWSATAKIVEHYCLGEVVPNNQKDLEKILEKMYLLWKKNQLNNYYRHRDTSNFLHKELSKKLFNVIKDIAL